MWVFVGVTVGRVTTLLGVECFLKSHTLCFAFFLSTRHGFAVPGLPSTGGLPHLSPVEVALRMQRLPELQTPDEFQEWRKWMDAFVGVGG